MADLRIILVGKTGAGKSSSGNTILGEEHFQKASSLESVTKTCERGEMEIGDQIVEIIDTPGLFDTKMSEEELKAEIGRCIYMSVPGPHVFLLVIRLDVRFTEERNTVKWIQNNFGEDAARYTIILFTHADHLTGESLDGYIKGSEDLMALVHLCGGRSHLFHNENRGNSSQVTKLLEKIKKMVKENGGQHYTNEQYKEAQEKINQEAFRQSMKDMGKNVLTAIGAVAVVVVAGGAAIAAGTAGGAAVAALARAAATFGGAGPGRVAALAVTTAAVTAVIQRKLGL